MIPLKVLHIFGQMAPGGAELRTLELQPYLYDMGVHFDFCALDEKKGRLAQYCEKRGSSVHHCSLKRGLVSFSRRFLNLLNTENYDVIHSHVHYFSGWIALLGRIGGVKKRIVHFRNMSDGAAASSGRKLYAALMKGLINRNATSILGVCEGSLSHAWRKDWQKDFRCMAVYNGLEIKKIENSRSARKELTRSIEVPFSSFLMLTVAHLHRQKGHSLLIDAAKSVIRQHPDIHFLFAGDGPLRKSLQNSIRSSKLGNNIHFLGLRSDVPELLASCDAFILPSLWEGLPGALLEALAAGLPAIASDLPGVREIASRSNLVHLFPAGNFQALSSAITEFYLQKETLGAEKSGAFPEIFTLSHCAGRMYEIYRQKPGRGGIR